MAQDPSKMTRNPRVDYGTSTSGLSSTSDTEYLRQQIADTRAGMTDTIDAIHDRVSPRGWMNRAKATLRESTVTRVKNLAQTAGNRARNLADTAGDRAGYLAARTAKTRERVMRITRENPVPAAVVSVAAVWLLVRTLRMRSRRRHNYLYEEPAF